jgi:hypothetical protein
MYRKLGANPMNDNELKEYLAAAFEHIKTLHDVLSSVMTDAAALRETILHVSPGWRDEFERQTMRQAEIAHALTSPAIQLYDELIRRLRAN